MTATAPLFSAAAYRAHEMDVAAAPRLQVFFDANPEYFLIVGGKPPRPTEALEEFADLPPAGMPYTKRWMIEVRGDGDAMAGMGYVVSDLLARDVWHIGLFIVATSLHGSGAARDIYAGLEGWIRAQGAQWLRLGVVQGNARAERFWERQGYLQTRTRLLEEPGERTNTIRAMVKPLAGGNVAEYLALVARDRPESP